MSIIDHISQGAGAYGPSKSRMNTGKKAASPRNGREPEKTGSPSDKVEISGRGRSLMERETLVSEIRDTLAQLPRAGERRDVVRKAVTRILTGYYEGEEAGRDIIDSLVEELSGPPAAETTGTGPSPAEEQDEILPEKIIEVQKRIQQGYYDRLDIMTSVIDRLLDE